MTRLAQALLAALGRKTKDQSPKLMPSILASCTMEELGSTIFSFPATSSRGTLTISRFCSRSLKPYSPFKINFAASEPSRLANTRSYGQDCRLSGCDRGQSHERQSRISRPTFRQFHRRRRGICNWTAFPVLLLGEFGVLLGYGSFCDGQDGEPAASVVPLLNFCGYFIQVIWNFGIRMISAPPAIPAFRVNHPTLCPMTSTIKTRPWEAAVV